MMNFVAASITSIAICVNSFGALCVTPEMIDFGLLSAESGAVERTITFENTGSEIMQLSLIGTTCACAEIQPFKQTIMPDTKREVVVVVDPKRSKRGRNLQRLLFASDQTDQAQIAVQAIWEIKRPVVDISPKKIDIHLLKQDLKVIGKQFKNSVYLVDSWDQRLELTSIETSPNLAACMYDMTYQCTKGVRIHVFRINIFLLPSTPVGPLNEWLRCITNHPKYPEITIPVAGIIQGSVKVFPKMVLFRNTNIDSNLNGKVISIVSGIENAKIRLGKIESKEPWLNIQPVDVSANKCELEIHPKLEALKTNHPNVLKGEITIEVMEPEHTVEKVKVIVLLGSV